jgi:hypothetical protein
MAGAVATAFVVAMVAAGSAQDTNPRFGRWKLKSEAPAPQSNIMTYAPYGDGGMSITIETVNRDGEAGTPWGYNTMFDGEFRPLFGREGQTAAVRMITDEVAEIVYKRGDQISQVLTNVISPDGNTLGIIYMRPGRDGRPDSVSFATYERIQ